MDAMNLPPGDADVTKLSGGERRRVALCKMLLEKPDLLLLDEPTNHLDAESVAWLERHLAEYPGTVVAVTHDRYFLDNVAKWILELDRGRASRSKATTPPGWSRSRPGWQVEEKAGVRPAEDAGPRAGVGSHARPGPARPRARPASRPTRRWRPSSFEERPDEFEIQIPPGKHLGDLVVEANEPQQGLRRPPADREPQLPPARRAASSASSAPTAPARRRCSA